MTHTGDAGKPHAPVSATVCRVETYRIAEAAQTWRMRGTGARRVSPGSLSPAPLEQAFHRQRCLRRTCCCRDRHCRKSPRHISQARVWAGPHVAGGLIRQRKCVWAKASAVLATRQRPLVFLPDRYFQFAKLWFFP